MKHRLSLILLLAVSLTLLPRGASAEDKDAKKPDDKKPAGKKLFHDLNYTKALAQAKKDNKLVMLDFTTTWCGWCKKLDADTFSKDDVQKFLSKNTIAIKVDGDKEKDLVKQYKVRGYPTLVFVNVEGKEVGRLVGYRPPDKFLEEAAKQIKKEKD